MLTALAVLNRITIHTNQDNCNQYVCDGVRSQLLVLSDRLATGDNPSATRDQHSVTISRCANRLAYDVILPLAAGFKLSAPTRR